MPTWRFLTFQDANSPTIEQLLYFHDHTITTLVLIIIIIIYVSIAAITSKFFNNLILENQEIERIWTMTPALVLIIIAIPSMKALYLMEDTKNVRFVVKTTGHQWYWRYEHNLMEDEEDSFIENRRTLRLLKCSRSLRIPTNLTTQIVVTSNDVIHSWTIPSIGVKTDAIPGRLNQIFLLPKRSGVFFGQCSEICGANHSFMPIIVESRPLKSI